MNTSYTLKLVSWICLALVLVPSVLAASGILGLGSIKIVALIGTIGWFATTPFWLGKDPDEPSAQ
ncbi:MAG: hypothetical protein AAFV88_10945 [Planctomycetota bacterium]